MPWIKNENGNDQYKTSAYAKEELPTWNEIWREFWLNKVFTYDPNNPEHNHTEMIPDSEPTTLIKHTDMYWKIPHRKVLLGLMCNQLNKMLYEDSMMTDMVNMINNSDHMLSVSNICFALAEVNTEGHVYFGKTSASAFIACKETIPPIYSMNLPSTDSRSIFASDHTWIDMKSFTQEIHLIMRVFDSKLNFEWGSESFGDESIFERIIHMMLTTAGIEDYFSGDVGWKDNETGKNMPSDQPERKCRDLGADAAL